MKRPVFAVLVAAAPLVAWYAPAEAQTRPVMWAASASPAGPVAPGAVVRVRLTATVDPGWHLYSLTQGAGGPIPTRIRLAADQPFQLADSIQAPGPTKSFDPNFGIPVEMYNGTVQFVLPVRVSRDARSGIDSIAVETRFQACDATLCMPPRTERIAVPVAVRAAPARLRPAASGR